MGVKKCDANCSSGWKVERINGKLERVPCERCQGTGLIGDTTK